MLFRSERIAIALDLNQESECQMLANSFMVSADNAHAVHPNHPELSDPTNRPYLNQGIVIKYNANQKYTTDSFSGAYIKKICIAKQIPYQEYTNRSNILGGSTLGNILTSHISIPAADIGIPQLSMHSAVETCGVEDVQSFYSFCKSFFNH